MFGTSFFRTAFMLLRKKQGVYGKQPESNKYNKYNKYNN